MANAVKNFISAFCFLERRFTKVKVQKRKKRRKNAMQKLLCELSVSMKVLRLNDADICSNAGRSCNLYVAGASLHKQLMEFCCNIAFGNFDTSESDVTTMLCSDDPAVSQ